MCEFREVETGKGDDAVERRPQLKAALAACKRQTATLVMPSTTASLATRISSPRPRRTRTSDLSWCSTARASAPAAKVKDGFVLPPRNAWAGMEPS